MIYFFLTINILKNSSTKQHFFHCLLVQIWEENNDNNKMILTRHPQSESSNSIILGVLFQLFLIDK